ncbi:MAG TPA: PAS domain S-box protein [Hyphomonadaceae bacterium]|nr:PAS domain S-box protein [Hyphomonadaceae bacterium]
MRDADARIIAASKLLRDAGENRRARIALRESQERLAHEIAGARTLQAISTRLISEVNQEALFAHIVDAAMVLMNADASSIQMLAPDGKTLILLGWRNFHPLSAEFWRHVTTDGECACGQALRNQQRAVFSDVEACEGLEDTAHIVEYRRSEIRAVQSTPLYSRMGSPLGMLSTHWRDPHVPTDGEFRLFDVLARQAADLIERTRAETALRTSETKYRTLFESMDEAFYLTEIVRDQAGRPVDLLYLDENAAGIRLVGISVVGKRLSKLNAGALPEWLSILDRVAQSGKSERFEKFATSTDRWQDYHLFPVGTDRVGILSSDISGRKLAEDALRESEEKFRAIANTSPVIIWMSDAGSKCVFVNQPWLDFTGQTLEQALDDGGWSAQIHPEDVPVCTSIYRQALERLERFQMYFRLRRADGEYRWIVSSGAPRYHADGSFAGYVGSSIDVTERRQAEEALATINQRLADAQEDERARIARELHDDVVQRLVGLGWRLGAAGSPAPASSCAIAEIDNVRSEIMSLARDVQTLSHRLHPGWMEVLGIAAAAKALCREMSRQSGVEIVCRVECIPEGLPRDNAVCLHRVLQEALQNAIKHSRAAEVEVSIRAVLDEVEMTVKDFGVGFDPVARGHQGLGLTSMRERLKAVGGRLSIVSQQNGTTIHAFVPIARPGLDAADLPSADR